MNTLSKMYPCVLIAVFGLLVASCGGASFGGDGETVEGPRKGGQDLNSGPKISGPSLSGDDQAINNCLKKWGDHPFSEEQVRNYRKINASVQVLGIGNPIVDEQVTNGPALILIGAAVNVLSPSARYRLMNPNGWYCLKVDVNVLSRANIDLHCKASIMDSKVNVAVFSNADAAGGVGVSVLSNVKLNRTGNGC